MKKATITLAIATAILANTANAERYLFRQTREIVYFKDSTAIDSRYDSGLFYSSGQLIVDTDRGTLEWESYWNVAGESIPLVFDSSYTMPDDGSLSADGVEIVIIQCCNPLITQLGSGGDGVITTTWRLEGYAPQYARSAPASGMTVDEALGMASGLVGN